MSDWQARRSREQADKILVLEKRVAELTATVIGLADQVADLERFTDFLRGKFGDEFAGAQVGHVEEGSS